MEERIPCACNCGTLIDARDRRNRPRRYLKHHGGRYPTEAKRLAAIRNLNKGRPKIPWNKGRTYLISKRAIYANKGAWHNALIRMFGNACMRCSWSEAKVDAHHIIAKSKGGPFTLDNGVLLCPNCHRLAHTFPEVKVALPTFRAAAIQVNPSY